MSYTYDSMGDMLTSSNGVGVTFNYTYDTAERLTSMSSTLQDSSHPGTLVSGLQYNAMGSLTASSLGSALNESFKWDCRGRVLGYASAVAPATASQSLANTAGCPNPTAMNAVPSTFGIPDPALRLASLLNPDGRTQSIMLSGTARRRKDHGLVKVTLPAGNPMLQPEEIVVTYREGETALRVAQLLAEEINRRRSLGLAVKVRPLGSGAIVDLSSRDTDPWHRSLSAVQVSISSNRKMPSIRASSLGPPGGAPALWGGVQTTWMERQ